MSPRIDEITEGPCAACGKPVALTWTKSAEGHGVLHGACFERKEATE